MARLRRIWSRLVVWSAPLFPDQNIWARELRLPVQIAFLVVFTLLFAVGARAYQPGGFLGFDWVNFFSQGLLPPFYPPWGQYVLQVLTWPLLIGVTLA
ncbi:MAG: hypothetical protein ABI847_05950, partial [Anaerolineales bacterium]